MRIRQIKPEWWRDKTLMTKAKADTREFYVGLWMTADDGGWLEWDATAIGAEVYPFLPVNRREREVERHAQILEELESDTPHLIRHVCGHAEVRKMPQHQRVQEAKRVYTHRNRHLATCVPQLPAGPRGKGGRQTAAGVDASVQLGASEEAVPQLPAGSRIFPSVPLPVGNVTVGNVTVDARERDEFKERMAAAGLKAPPEAPRP